MARPLDPYRTLELPRDATLDEVKAAYRRLAKRYHPDSAGERAVPHFLAVQAAYEALTEGPGRIRPVIGGRQRATSSSPVRPSAARAGRPAADGSRGARGAAAGGPSPAASRPGSRAGAGAAGAASAGFSASAASSGDGAGGGRAGPSRGRGSAGPRPRRTKRAPGSTSYDGADSEPFEPEWAGASWYGGSSGTYWTINPREFADPRKHGPEYQARAAEGARGPRPRRARTGVGGASRPGQAEASPEAVSDAADREATAGTARPGWSASAASWGAERRPYGAQAGRVPDDWSPRHARRSRPTEVSPFSLVAMALLAIALLAVLFALMAEPASPGAASVVPIVAFCGIAIVALVRVLRRDGRPRT
jgi:hypothetical protein